jgi:hypothetical protein
MELDTIQIFVPHKGLQTLTKAEFMDNLRLGVYDGVTIEIIETTLK